MEDHGEIGRGAFGAVNRMIHTRSGTEMAVKRIRSTVDEREQKQLLMDLEVVGTCIITHQYNTLLHTFVPYLLVPLLLVLSDMVSWLQVVT